MGSASAGNKLSFQFETFSCLPFSSRDVVGRDDWTFTVSDLKYTTVL